MAAAGRKAVPASNCKTKDGRFERNRRTGSQLPTKTPRPGACIFAWPRRGGASMVPARFWNGASCILNIPRFCGWRRWSCRYWASSLTGRGGGGASGWRASSTPTSWNSSRLVSPRPGARPSWPCCSASCCCSLSPWPGQRAVMSCKKPRPAASTSSLPWTPRAVCWPPTRPRTGSSGPSWPCST